MWLLDTNLRKSIEKAEKSGSLPTIAQQIEYESRYSASSGDYSSRILSVSGGNAEISIKGVITKSPSFLAAIFGGSNVTYSEIQSALLSAASDSEIETITLAIDSPGGQFDGLFDTLATIQSIDKPVKAIISNVGASAAFAIASQADEIVASNIAARIGSVGIVATFNLSDDEIDITSTDAPKKRPDVTTDEGRAMVIEELDAMHEIFVDAIAQGRGVTTEKVNAEFGQGATLLAGEALKRGMIDGIIDNTKTTTASSGGNQTETVHMDLKTLEAQHPDVYAAAVQKGVDQERDRVSAHLTMAEASGDNKTAFSAIKDGSEMTATLQAIYMTAGMNRSDIAARQNDDLNASTDDSVATTDVDDSEAVVKLVEAKLGLGA